MIEPTAGFIVYGTHKDSLKDPMGRPFIDEKIIEQSKNALKNRGIKLIEYGTVIATKKEAAEALKKMKDNDEIDCVIL
ncbi:MAG: hypothetical protein KAR18_07900, partial [Spirochaetes bacterium]|nr:hypothetical protein [Spirochaetota bacterium]